ncbi:hypothetical protein [Streptomyces sp. NPDC060194]|uniref:hypothetical protein n=1 Tax=Streptomyces sp. NPDC060194 TaxID=3347069 RepID=UPI00365F8282
MRSTSARWVMAATATVMATALSACGSDGGSGNGLADQSAQQISDKSEKAFKEAKSVHMKMDGAAVGGQGGSGKIDLHLDREGNCKGTISQGEQGTVELVKQGDKVWMKPDAAFWRTQVPGKGGEAAAETFKGRYIYGSTSDQMLKGMAETCDLGQLQTELTKDDDSDVKLKKGEETDVAGTSAIPLSGRKDGATQTVYVSTDGKPYPLKITSEGGADSGNVTFEKYDEPVPSDTPSKNESIDVAKLQQEMGAGASSA